MSAVNSITSITSSSSSSPAKVTKAKAPKKEKSMSEIIAPEVEELVRLAGLASRSDLEAVYEPANSYVLYDSYQYVTTLSAEAKKADPRKPWVSLSPGARIMLATLFVRMLDEIKELDAVALARVANVNLSPEEQQRIAAESKGDPIKQAGMLTQSLNMLRSQALAREVSKHNGPDSLTNWASKLTNNYKFAATLAGVIDSKKYFHGKISHLLKCEPTSVIPLLASFIYESLLKIISAEIAIDLWVEHETIKPAHIHQFMVRNNVPEIICDDVLSSLPEAKPRVVKVKKAAAVITPAPAVDAALNQV